MFFSFYNCLVGVIHNWYVPAKLKTMPKQCGFTLLLLFTLFKECGAQKIADTAVLNMLTGNWSTRHEWGFMQETWMPFKDGNMIGNYRCTTNDKPVIYEMKIIEVTDSKPF